MSSGSLKEPPFLIGADSRQAVESTILKHCEIRTWELHAVNARSNHVHVVVTAPEYQPDIVARQFKAWCTKKLQPVYPGRTKFWTEGTSCRWINTDGDLGKAIEYTLEGQVR